MITTYVSLAVGRSIGRAESPLVQVQKRWATRDDFGGPAFGHREIRGKTVGLLGYGHVCLTDCAIIKQLMMFLQIGREAARLSAAFGANIIAANPSGTKKPQDGYIIPGTGDPDGR